MGTRPGVSTDERAEIRRLKRENQELRRANEILKTASVFRSGARPHTAEMIAYVDAYRDCFGVEAICRVMRTTPCRSITARGYWVAKVRPPSDRQLRDSQLLAMIERLHAVNYSVYGRRKMWHALRREGWDVGRDQCARLLRIAGLCGAR